MCGNNAFGQLAFGDIKNRSIPEISVALAGMKIFPGYDHIFAVDPENNLYVCGDSWYQGLQNCTPVPGSSFGLFRVETDAKFYPAKSKVKSAMSYNNKPIGH